MGVQHISQRVWAWKNDADGVFASREILPNNLASAKVDPLPSPAPSQIPLPAIFIFYNNHLLLAPVLINLPTYQRENRPFRAFIAMDPDYNTKFAIHEATREGKSTEPKLFSKLLSFLSSSRLTATSFFS